MQPGTEVDSQFIVESELGRGGMGCVLVVRWKGQSGKFALKYCTATEPEAKKRFAREVRISQTIENPRVMPILHANPDFDPPYFIMPLAESKRSIFHTLA